MYDGITGFFTQPVIGAKKEGTAGFFKGFGKGLAGITLKPAAGEFSFSTDVLYSCTGIAFWAVPGYTFQGIYKEIKKRSGSSLQNYFIAARTAQGFEEWAKSTPEERTDILRRWDAMQDEIRNQKKPRYKPFTKSQEAVGSKHSKGGTKQRGTTSDSPDEQLPSIAQLPPRSPSQDTAALGQSLPRGDQSEYEDAIQNSVIATSTGNPEEDAMVEQAIRQSLLGLQSHQPMTQEEEARAESLRGDIHRAQGEPSDTGSSTASMPQDQRGATDNDDDGLRQAIEASQEKTREEKEEELELARAMYESRKAHADQQKAQDEEDAVVEYIKRQTLAENQGQSSRA
jgi:hypothetical protein